MRLALPLTAALLLSACATTGSPGGPRDVVAGVVPALEAMCGLSPDDRTPDQMRARAARHGFSYWGEFVEYEAMNGSIDVRFGPNPPSPCTLTFMLNRQEAERVDTALRRWADRRGLEPGMEGPLNGLTQRRRDGPGGILTWTVTPSAVDDEPALVDAVWDLADPL